MISVPRLLFQTHQHQPRAGQNEEGQHEQQQAEQDQAGLVQSSLSANSLAIAAEIVVPGANTDEEMRNELPMMKVTAMVSPSARPSPSIMPPITPTRV